jgi:hypothetical protein
MSSLQRPFTAAMLVPTGIGARIGGYGGDAMQAMNLLARAVDRLITHPNVANAACFQQLPDNALYVEGYGLDQLFRNRWALRPVRRNRVGVVFDRGMEPRMRTLHRNTLNAVRTVYGVEILDEVETEAPVDLSLEITPSGASLGVIRNPDVILRATETLLQNGADAIALAVQMVEPPHEDSNGYAQGVGVDPVGGLEALLSHLVVSTFRVPCANAPVFPWEDACPRLDEEVDPRTASEYIVPTFLPCVLTGLARAPRFVPAEQARAKDILLEDVDALIVPADALGGVPVLAALEQSIPVITVADNTTILSVDAALLAGQHLSDWLARRRLIPVRSYAEAAGTLLALRHGLSIP